MFSRRCVSLIKMNFFLNFPRKIKDKNHLKRGPLLSQFLYLLAPSLLTVPTRPPDKTTRLDPLLPEANLSKRELERSPCGSFSPASSIKPSGWTSLCYRSLLLSGKGSAFCPHHRSYCFYPTLSPPPPPRQGYDWNVRIGSPALLEICTKYFPVSKSSPVMHFPE